MQLSFDVVIIGGGPYAAALVDVLRRDTRTVALIEPGDVFGLFSANASNIGMTHMRSGWNVSLCGPEKLVLSVGLNKHMPPPSPFPSVAMMRTHVQNIGACFSSMVHLRTTATKLSPLNVNDWQVITDDGTDIVAKHVIIATGLGEHRVKPFEHTVAIPEKTVRAHVGGHVAIIGTGMTASHAAMKLVDEGASKVTVIGSEGFRTSGTEIPIEWLESRGAWGCGGLITPEERLNEFSQDSAYRRLRNFRDGNLGGTINVDHMNKLERHIQAGKIVVVHERVKAVKKVRRGRLRILFERDWVEPISGFAAVYDARGYKLHVDNLTRIDCLREQIGDHHLAGMPVLDRWLQIRPGLLMTGAIAGLTLGPASHTIAAASFSRTMFRQYFEQERKRRFELRRITNDDRYYAEQL